MNDVDKFIESIPVRMTAQLPSLLALRDTRVEKEDGSYVTKGDLLAQTCVLDAVDSYLQGANVISEELSAAELIIKHNGWTVVVDPIDGTENFTSGLPLWGVAVSVYCADRHVASVLGCPELNQWLRSGEKFPSYMSRIRGLSSSLNRDQILSATQGFEYRIFGCCVFNMLSVIRGSLLSFENPKGANSWDILAGLNLALERGLHVTVDDKIYAGEYLYPNRKYRFKVQQQ